MCSGFPSSCFISLTCNVWMSYCWGSFRVLLDGIYIMANELVLFSTQTHCPFLLSYDLERKKDKSFSTLSDIFFFSTTWAQTLYLQWKGHLPLNTGEACIPKPSGFAFNMLLQQRLTLHTKFAVIKAHKKLASWCSWAYSCWIRIWGEFCRHQSPDPRKQRSPPKNVVWALPEQPGAPRSPQVLLPLPLYNLGAQPLFERHLNFFGSLGPPSWTAPLGWLLLWSLLTTAWDTPLGRNSSCSAGRALEQELFYCQLSAEGSLVTSTPCREASHLST